MSYVPSDKEQMASILEKIYLAHKFHEDSWDDVTGSYSKEMIDCFVAACDGDKTLGYTLYLMGGNTFNDIQDMSPYFGVGWRNSSEPNKVCTDIPVAPSEQHYWDIEDEEWKVLENNDKQKDVSSNNAIEMGWPLI